MPFFLDMETLIPLGAGLGMVVIRMAFLILAAPLFGSKMIPKQLVAASVVAFSIATFIGLPEFPIISTEPLDLITAAFGEAALGASAGLGARLVFAAVEAAGQVIGVPMGLGFSQAIDPLTQAQSVVTSRFLGAIVALMFLVMDVHHVLIKYLVASFKAIPPGQVVFSGEAGMTLALKASLIFSAAVQLAAPVLLVLLGIMVSLGMLARVAPKVNLFVLSFAISIGVGLVALRAALPNMVAYTRTVVVKIEPIVSDIMDTF